MGTSKKSRGNARNPPPPQLRSRTTRSSRARLITTDDTTNNTQLLTDQLRSLGLYAAPTVGDGNCLFRALSDQLYGSPSKHPQLRKEICDWIQDHKDRYEPFVEDERGLDVHLRCMRENATYGGHMELSAFAHMTRRNVKVIQPGLVYVIEWAAFGDDASPPQSQEHDEDEAEVLSGKERRKQRKERMRAEKGHEREDNDEEEGGDTVYVAYHDWEHFSSIRNLRGPHTGLPNVRETPAPQSESSPPPPREKPRSKASKEKSSKKVEAEPTEERKVPKVKLRISAPPTRSTTPAETRPGSSTLKPPSDPTSRATSPPTSKSGSSVPSSSCSTLSSLSTLTSSSCTSLEETHTATSDGLPPGSPMKLTSSGESPLAYYTAAEEPAEEKVSAPSSSAGRAERSPKRSFEESSASDGEDVPSQERGKRSRSEEGEAETKEREREYEKEKRGMQVDSHSHSEVDSEYEFVDVEDADEETPALSSPSSSSTSPSPPPPPARKERGSHPYQKPVLSQRERKKMGLPKHGGSAGKIKIPGGRYRKAAQESAPVPPPRETEGDDAEWRKNGTGRVDVRGFRELKI